MVAVVLDDLRALSARKYVTPYGVALVQAELGDRDQAFTALDQAVADRSNWLGWLKLDPRFENLHGDPRFDALVRRVGAIGPRGRWMPSILRRLRS